jgi:hypothetical protein
VNDFEFTIDNVKSLVQKLTVQQDLSRQEYVLLLAIFAAAAARAEVVNPKTGTSTLPLADVVGKASGSHDGYASVEDLRQQLLKAYIPGKYFDYAGTEQAKTVGSGLSARVANPGAGEGGRPVT